MGGRKMNVSKYYMMVIVLLVIAISIIAISEFYQKHKQKLEFEEEINDLEYQILLANREIVNIQSFLSEFLVY